MNMKTNVKMAASKKGSVIIEIFVMLILVVMTSAIILSLLKFNIIDIKSGEQEPILNTEFIPLEREGSLAVNSFSFCRYVDAAYHCLQEMERFPLGADVHFLFSLETSPVNEQIIIAENYQLKNPQGSVILDVDARDDFFVEGNSEKKPETVTFKDYFTTDLSLEEGIYTLELHLDNPLINKNMKVTKTVELYKK